VPFWCKQYSSLFWNLFDHSSLFWNLFDRFIWDVGKRFLTGACVCYKGKQYDREKDGTVLSLRDISSCSSFFKNSCQTKQEGIQYQQKLI